MARVLVHFDHFTSPGVSVDVHLGRKTRHLAFGYERIEADAELTVVNSQELSGQCSGFEGLKSLSILQSMYIEHLQKCEKIWL